MSFLTLLLITFGIHFKHLEIASLNLNLYIIPLVLGAAMIPICALVGKKRNFRSRVLSSPGIYLAVLVGMGMVQAVFTDHPPETKAVLIFSMGFLIFAVTLFLLQYSSVKFLTIFRCLAIYSIISTVFLILQTTISHSFDAVPFFSRIGLLSDQVGDITELVETRGRGLARSVIDYAIHNFIPFFWLFYSSMNGTGLRRVGHMFLFGFLFVGVIISTTDGFFVGVLAAVGIYYLERISAWRDMRFSKLLALVVGVCLFSFVAVPYISEAALGAEAVVSSSIVSRLYLWSVGISMFVDRPWTGIGLGKFSYYVSDYDPFFYVNYHHPAVSAHSWFIDFMASGGIICILAFLAFILVTYREARYCCKFSNAVTDKVLFLAFVGYAVMGLFGSIHLFCLDYYFMGAFVHARFRVVREAREAMAKMPVNDPAIADIPQHMLGAFR